MIYSLQVGESFDTRFKKKRILQNIVDRLDRKMSIRDGSGGRGPKSAETWSDYYYIELTTSNYSFKPRKKMQDSVNDCECPVGVQAWRKLKLRDNRFSSTYL